METAGKIGSEGSYDLKVADGQVQVTVGYVGDQLSSSLIVSVPVKVYLDKLASAFPGLPSDIIKGLETAMGLA